MKKLKCPICHTYLVWDDATHQAGDKLTVRCGECQHTFTLHIPDPASTLPDARAGAQTDTPEETPAAYLVVVENQFTKKQTLPLYEGENIAGRKNKGMQIELPIETSDPSMDRRHCLIEVCRTPQGDTTCSIMDNDSLTGTYLHLHQLQRQEKAILHEGDIITLGATTLIFKTSIES